MGRTEAQVFSALQSVSVALIFLFGSTAAPAAPSTETVDVKYRGPVNLAPFTCEDTTRSSFIRRVCYDTHNAYMLIQLRNTWYHYCELDQKTFDAFIASPSMGEYFNRRIKGTGADGPFDCRTHRVPNY